MPQAGNPFCVAQTSVKLLDMADLGKNDRRGGPEGHGTGLTRIRREHEIAIPDDLESFLRHGLAAEFDRLHADVEVRLEP